MYAATTSVALVGGEARPVEVQVHIGRQQEAFRLSGLPDTAVREAKDRVRAAVVSTGVRFPNRTVTVNLAPADLPKAGTDFDLPIALGVLAAGGDIRSLAPAVSVGELALDGSVRAGLASLGAAVLSARTGLPCLVASEVAGRAAIVRDSTVFGVSSLAEALALLGPGRADRAPAIAVGLEDVRPIPDMSEVEGQPLARRALEVAAAGGHHLLLHGPPGGGKTMLAMRLPGILPALSHHEAVEVALLHNAAGIRRDPTTLRPFRSPHHTASRAALVGGGSGVPVPGEVSLAHRGVLFLDEVAEFPRANLDSMRQPLEDGHVTVARRGMSVRFPSRFQLVAATNPCPCGYHGDHRRACRCTASEVARYRSKVSGPLVDRMDLVVRVGRVEASSLGATPGEGSASIRRRVDQASRIMAEAATPVAKTARGMIVTALEEGLLTARGAARLKSLASTIAALAGSDQVSDEHVAEAFALRGEW
jgi:magnesium chelatase family protein